jgi:branched-chain amino acid aminotransferase
MTRYAWLDGELVPWQDAKVHIRTEAVMRGASVFEGIRGYRSAGSDELFLFKLQAHLSRLQESMKILRMQLPYSVDRLGDALIELLRASSLHEDIHARPTVYFGEGESFGYQPGSIQVGAFISAVPMPQTATLENGVAVAVSSWERISDHSMPPRVKSAGNYLNSRLAHVQAVVDGYDDAVLLDHDGKVTESPGSCLMLVRRGRVITPRVTDSILESITRDTLLQLLQNDLGIEVEEREIDRTELYVADEVFQCGSGYEIRPIVSVDRYPVKDGRRGSVTEALQSRYFDVVRGNVEDYRQWLTPVYATVAVGPSV